jgi:release factor glutamine methyltransferase
MTWTPKALLGWCTGHFEGKGIPSARLDAERLLAHALGCSRLDLYLNFDKPLAEAELNRFRELVRRRGEREPLAYLTGEAGFWNLTLCAAPGCLVPRPETETLVEAVLDAVRERRAGDRDATDPALRIVELGTGSAAIPLAVLSETCGLSWLAVERSRAALGVARENVRRYAELLTPRCNHLQLVRGDALECVRGDFRPDLVVSNPPYIPSVSIDALEPEVSRWEPREALDGGPDGLRWYRYLLDFARARLAPGGALIVEIGHDQAAAVNALNPAGLARKELRRDLGGRDRVLWWERDG